MPLRIEVNPEAPGSGGDVARAVERAAHAALEDRGVTDAELSITLMDDAGMTAMNREWKGRDAPTDVLAFPLHEPGQPPLGDVYLGFDRGSWHGWPSTGRSTSWAGITRRKGGNRRRCGRTRSGS